jgi:hypothetical protein
VVQYWWTWDLGHGGGEGDAVFQVYVEGSPPVIVSIFISPILH